MVRGGFSCAVKGCSNISGRVRGISFFLFPKNPIRAQLWIECIKREDLAKCAEKLHKHYKVCSQHFSPSMFMNDLRNRLFEHAYPNINMDEETLPTTASSNHTALEQEVTRSNSYIDTCRVCLETFKKLYPLQGPIKNCKVEICEMISFCIAEEMDLSDDLPQNVCFACFKIIMTSYNFINQFNNNQKKLLNKRLQKIKAEKNDRAENTLNMDEEFNLFEEELQIKSEEHIEDCNHMEEENICESSDSEKQSDLACGLNKQDRNEQGEKISADVKEYTDTPEFVEIRHLHRIETETDMRTYCIEGAKDDNKHFSDIEDTFKISNNNPLASAQTRMHLDRQKDVIAPSKADTCSYSTNSPNKINEVSNPKQLSPCDTPKTANSFPLLSKNAPTQNIVVNANNSASVPQNNEILNIPISANEIEFFSLDISSSSKSRDNQMTLIQKNLLHAEKSPEFVSSVVQKCKRTCKRTRIVNKRIVKRFKKKVISRRAKTLVEVQDNKTETTGSPILESSYIKTRGKSLKRC